MRIEVGINNCWNSIDSETREMKFCFLLIYLFRFVRTFLSRSVESELWHDESFSFSIFCFK